MAAKEKAARRFGSEVGVNTFPDAERISLDDMLDLDITVYDYSELEGQFGDFVVILFKNPAVENSGFCTTSCGGKVVMKKLRQAKEKGALPLLGKIIKPATYYDII